MDMQMMVVTMKETSIHVLVHAVEACLAMGVRHNRVSILGMAATVISPEQEVEGMEGEGDLVAGCSGIMEAFGVIMVVVLVDKAIDRHRVTEMSFHIRQAMKLLYKCGLGPINLFNNSQC
jgi:hypothetical protein